MKPTIPVSEAARIAKHVVEWCVAAKSQETILLVTDERSDDNLAEALWIAAEYVGAHVLKVVLPHREAKIHGYLTWTEPPQSLARLMADSDIVLGYTCNLFCLTQAVAEARVHGTRFMWLPGSYDFRRSLVMQEDWPEIDGLGRAICQRLDGTHKLFMENPGGTRLEVELSAERKPFWDDTRATKSGELDFFPGGMWNTVPVTESVTGRAVFEGHLHPVGILTQPVAVEYQDGRLVSIDGGRQAIEWEQWLLSFGDEGIFEFSHLSGGLAKHARVYGHDWEDLIIRGSILLSGGENVLYGGENMAKAHFDGVVLNADLSVDGKFILRGGEYLL